MVFPVHDRNVTINIFVIFRNFEMAIFIQMFCFLDKFISRQPKNSFETQYPQDTFSYLISNTHTATRFPFIEQSLIQYFY